MVWPYTPIHQCLETEYLIIKLTAYRMFLDGLDGLLHLLEHFVLIWKVYQCLDTLIESLGLPAAIWFFISLIDFAISRITSVCSFKRPSKPLWNAGSQGNMDMSGRLSANAGNEAHSLSPWEVLHRRDYPCFQTTSWMYESEGVRTFSMRDDGSKRVRGDGSGRDLFGLASMLVAGTLNTRVERITAWRAISGIRKNL